ncbi:hypothetical protein Bca4012_055792 [Brassica carinata]
MGGATWFEADGTKRGKWSEEEDQKLVAYIDEYGIGDWRFVPHRTVIAQHMPGRSDNDIKNHWNSCLKKRLKRNGIDPVTHQPIINLAVKTPLFNTDCVSSSSLTVIPSSSSPSGSARLLNKIATSISSRQRGVEEIKDIMSDPIITRINDQAEEFEELKKDKGKILASSDDQDEFLMWDEEKVRRFMEEIDLLRKLLQTELVLSKKSQQLRSQSSSNTEMESLSKSSFAELVHSLSEGNIWGFVCILYPRMLCK